MASGFYRPNNYGAFYIGAGIQLCGLSDSAILRIFPKASSDSSNPNAGGISSDTLQIIFDVNRLNGADPSDSLKTKMDGVCLTSYQVTASFNSYVNMMIWDKVKNSSSWEYGHWGALAHNAMPESVRTAVTDYLFSSQPQLSISPEINPDTAFISYAASMGLAYYTGFRSPIRMWGIVGVDKVQTETGSIIDPQAGDYTAPFGVSRNESIGNIYFGWIADIIARTTLPGATGTASDNFRSRRINEANLIYSFIGLPAIPSNLNVAELPYAHTLDGLIARKFNQFTAAEIYRYANSGAPQGADPATLSQSGVNVTFSKGIDGTPVTQGTKEIIKKIAAMAGVTKVVISSTSRTIEKQCQVMVDNANSPVQGIAGAYALYKGAVMRGLIDIINLAKFYNKKIDGVTPAGLSRTYAADVAVNGSVQTYKIDSLNASDRTKVIDYCIAYLNQHKSSTGPHTRDFNEWQVIDLAPSGIVPQSMESRFMATLAQATSMPSPITGESLIFKYVKKGNGEPAHHIEIKAAVANAFSPTSNLATPNEGPFKLSETFRSQSNWQVAFSLDSVTAAKAQA
jgi:hypothetical protein